MKTAVFSEYNYWFSRPENVTFIGFSGLKAENLNRDHLNEVVKLQPDLTIIMIGGNDVSFYEKMPFLKIKASDETFDCIMKFRESLLERQVPTMVAGVIQRNSGAAAIDKLNETLYLSLEQMFIGFGQRISKNLSHKSSKYPRIHLDETTYRQVFQKIMQRVSSKILYTRFLRKN